MGYEWAELVLAMLRNIEPYEVMQVLHEGRRWPRPAVGRSEVKMLTIWGRTRSGRPLIVRIQRLADWDSVILGARDMTPAEVEEFTRWEQQ